VTQLTSATLRQRLVGESQAIRDAREHIAQAATVNMPVLLVGETGTGKHTAAQMLHEMSKRHSRPFIHRLCLKTFATDFEEELLGIEEGYSRANPRGKQGLFELADDGSLFLDKIDDLDLRIQSVLLNVLHDSGSTRLGGTRWHPLDLRLICSTECDLAHEVAAARFQADLMFRISTLCITMPPLRNRPEDISPLVTHFLKGFSQYHGVHTHPISPSVMTLMERYSWPGNIRELENLVNQFATFGDERFIIDHVRAQHEDDPGPFDSIIDTHTPLRLQTQRVMRNLERRIILTVLQANNWNRKKAARTLDISYRALLYKIKAANIPPIRRHSAGLTQKGQP
jgi:two-component system response regulator AtoC